MAPFVSMFSECQYVSLHYRDGRQKENRMDEESSEIKSQEHPEIKCRIKSNIRYIKLYEQKHRIDEG